MPVLEGARRALRPARGPDPEVGRPAETVRGEMRYRRLGRTGEEVSVLGLGGSHLGRLSGLESVRIVRAAVDGRFELYKTSTKFDETARHPKWLGLTGEGTG
jgi:hypothetical protein